MGVNRAAMVTQSRKPGGSDDVFSPSQGVWQKLEGQRKRGEGSLRRCQGRPKGRSQQSQQTHKHRANRPNRIPSQPLVPHPSPCCCLEA